MSVLATAAVQIIPSVSLGQIIEFQTGVLVATLALQEVATKAARILQESCKKVVRSHATKLQETCKLRCKKLARLKN
jgi:hypothetical protein